MDIEQLKSQFGLTLLGHTLTLGRRKFFFDKSKLGHIVASSSAAQK